MNNHFNYNDKENLLYCVENYTPTHIPFTFEKGKWYNINDGCLGLSGSTINMTYNSSLYKFEEIFIDYNGCLSLNREEKINQLLVDE
jgi:hypothetical protein